MFAYLAPEGFEKELAHELAADVVSRHERLFVTTYEHRAMWAQNRWFDVQEIEVQSISDAAKKLRALGRFWALEPHVLHRRAQLIQEQLPKLRGEPLAFLGALPDREIGAWMMLSENRILAAPRTSSRFASGAVMFQESKVAPSRAYLKLWELFTVDGVRPRAGDKCLELGASPGGWTWVLANLGCEVIAVDRSPLADHVMAMPKVKFRSGNAFAVKPAEIGKIDWLFSDLICFPAQLEQLIREWLESGLATNFVCTIKFKGETDFVVPERLAQIPGAHVRHLAHNKHELTWWLLRDPS